MNKVKNKIQDKTEIDTYGDALRVQKDQMNRVMDASAEVDSGLSNLEDNNNSNKKELSKLNATADALLAERGLSLDDLKVDQLTPEQQALVALSEEEVLEIKSRIPKISDAIDTLNNGEDWDSYLNSVYQYGERNGIDFSEDPFDSLLSHQQKTDILKRIDEEFKIKKRCKCDNTDYMIAATCGAVGGLIDAFFVGKPGENSLGRWADGTINKAVEKFAKLNGWKGPRSGSDPTKSAILCLQEKYPVNYDHAHTGIVRKAVEAEGGEVFKLSTRDHHLKSLAHSPSPIGLFFSLLDQFTDRASFVSDGKLIRIASTGKHPKLQGGNFIAKLFCGFVNWIGHIISDMAGSTGKSKGGRGSGVPIPFFELLQFLHIGRIGEDKLPISELAVKIFREGYDFRHGMAMSVTVGFTELSIRFLYGIRQYFYYNRSSKETLKAVSKSVEIRRMLLVGHGTLCLVDVVDAGIRSGGEPVQMLLRMNFIAWVRFGHLGFKEVLRLYKAPSDRIKAMDEALDKELLEIIGSGEALAAISHGRVK